MGFTISLSRPLSLTTLLIPTLYLADGRDRTLQFNSNLSNSCSLLSGQSLKSSPYKAARGEPWASFSSSEAPGTTDCKKGDGRGRGGEAHGGGDRGSTAAAPFRSVSPASPSGGSGPAVAADWQWKRWTLAIVYCKHLLLAVGAIQCKCVFIKLCHCTLW